MKRFLPATSSIFFEISNEILTFGSKSSMQRRILTAMKCYRLSLTTQVLLSLLIFMSISKNGIGQEVKSFGVFLSEISISEKTYFQSLLDDESSLSIYDNRIEFNGESVKVAIVDVNSINELYKLNPKFESIELIKIRLKNSTDLTNQVDCSKLSQCKNLKYILITSTFEVCPENSGNKECQLSKISNMFLPSETINPTIVFRTAIPM